MKNGKKHTYIRHNTHKGFDELARDLNITKEDVKRMWNEMELGWHSTPRTLISLTRIGQRQYELNQDLVVFIAPATPVVIPKGFVTDFASVPRFLWWFIAPDDDGIAVPAIAHDMLCRTGWVNRTVADSIFYQLMLHRRFRRAFWAFLAVFIAGLIRQHYPDKKLYNTVYTHTLEYIGEQDFDTM